MNKAKEILYKHAKSNGCKSDLLRNPFLEQAVLNAINEALTIPAVVGRSEQLVICKKCGSSEMYQYTKTKDKCEDCGNIQDY